MKRVLAFMAGLALLAALSGCSDYRKTDPGAVPSPPPPPADQSAPDQTSQIPAPFYDGGKSG